MELIIINLKEGIKGRTIGIGYRLRNFISSLDTKILDTSGASLVLSIYYVSKQQVSKQIYYFRIPRNTITCCCVTYHKVVCRLYMYLVPLCCLYALKGWEEDMVRRRVEHFLASFGKFRENTSYFCFASQASNVWTEEAGEWEIPDMISNTHTNTHKEQ